MSLPAAEGQMLPGLLVAFCIWVHTSVCALGLGFRAWGWGFRV